MISSGVKVLVIAAISSDSGAAVAAKAKAAGIPTIDYDRLTLGGSSDYYVSFDNEKVGELQGQGLADALKGKQGAQVIEVPGEPVHAVHHDSVPVTGETQQFFQLRSGGVPAGSLVREDPVQHQSVELALLVLVQCAHPHVSDPLPSHPRLQPSNVWN